MQNAAIVTLAITDMVLVTLSQIALWQRKEYRWDRMQSYLDSPEGSLKKQPWQLSAGLLVGIGWAMVLSGNTIFADYIGIASLFILLGAHGIRIRTNGVMRPVLTHRSGVVFLGTTLVCIAWGSYVIVPDTLPALQFATLLFFIPLLIAIIVFISSIPAAIQKRFTIAQAKTLRTSLNNLTVVGITGSVGKTSTKTYLLHILGGESASVKATSEHRNAPYVVALDMLSRLTKKTTTYIAEMAAYKKGEIRELAQLVQPKIGVVTAITNQHVALFKSLDNLAVAKWELIDALPEDGIAVLNADDERIVRKSKNLKKKTVWFSLQQKADVYIKNSSIIIGDESYNVELPIVSRGQIRSALAAVAVAHALGVSETKIIKQLATLPVIPRTMELKKGKAGSRIIDDSYSASEASVMNAIEYIQSLPKGDIRMVLVPIIELGSEGPAVHKRIGKALASLSVNVFIYGDAYQDDIQKGLGKSPKANVQWFYDAKEIATEVSKNMNAKTTIILEGRVPSIVTHSVIPAPEPESTSLGSRVTARDDNNL